jgi:hypothetical protein
MSLPTERPNQSHQPEVTPAMRASWERLWERLLSPPDEGPEQWEYAAPLPTHPARELEP